MRSWTRRGSNPRLPITLTNPNINPIDCGIRRGSGCSLRALAQTLDRGGGCTGVCVGRVEVTGLTLYHPPVASEGGICISQLSMKSLDLVLSSQQTSAYLHRHILVVDRVLQPALVATDPRCDGLPGGIGNNITTQCPEGWSLVSAEDPRSEENLCNGLELYSP
jgi:hypothetical protein